MKKLFKIIIIIFSLLLIGFQLIQKKDIPVATLKQKYCNSNSKFVTLDDIEIHYRIVGTGKPIVLIHGTGACLQTWDGWIDSLQQYYAVITLDMPGFGITGPNKTGDYTINYYINFLDRFLSTIGVDTIEALAGNSLGGQIAWNYASKFPNKVKNLVLLDPGGFYDGKKSNNINIFDIAKIKPLANAMNKIDTRFIVERTLKDVYEDDTKITEQAITMYYDMSMREGNRKAFTDRVQTIDNETLLDHKLITANTLTVWGREDKLIHVDNIKYYKEIPNSTTIIYDKVGHSPQEEIPATSVADMLKFLER